MLPYFKRAENNSSIRDDFHGGDGPLQVENLPNPSPLCATYLEAAKSIGIPFNHDFNGASQAGCGCYQATLKKGRRCSTAVAYIEPIWPSKFSPGRPCHRHPPDRRERAR